MTVGVLVVKVILMMLLDGDGVIGDGLIKLNLVNLTVVVVGVNNNVILVLKPKLDATLLEDVINNEVNNFLLIEMVK